jgi:hypothetical protein
MRSPPARPTRSEIPVIQPELRHIASPDLEPPTLPPDPADCAVQFQALIGPRGGDGAEPFSFTVVTAAHLARTLGHTWGRGYLIVDTFDWNIVVRAVAQLLAQCARETWAEIAVELDKELVRDPDRQRGSTE